MTGLSVAAIGCFDADAGIPLLVEDTPSISNPDERDAKTFPTLAPGTTAVSRLAHLCRAGWMDKMSVKSTEWRCWPSAPAYQLPLSLHTEAHHYRPLDRDQQEGTPFLDPDVNIREALRALLDLVRLFPIR